MKSESVVQGTEKKLEIRLVPYLVRGQDIDRVRKALRDAEAKGIACTRWDVELRRAARRLVLEATLVETSFARGERKP